MKKKRLKLSKISWIIIFSIIVLAIAISLFLIIENLKHKSEIKKTEDIINKAAKVVEITNDEPIKEDDTKPDIYWKFLNYSMISVDIDALKEINNETVGWIQVNNTNVNYPVVKHSDNEYYLNHQFDKTYNTAGWLFMDYRNDSDVDNNRNTIIYGHSLNNKALFGSLKKTSEESWYNNEDNLIIKTVSESKSYLWQIFSIYTFETNNDYIQTDFMSDDEYTDFLNLIKNRSKKNFGVDVNFNDRILTLSTCYTYGGGIKLVIHAKMIKES